MDKAQEEIIISLLERIAVSLEDQQMALQDINLTLREHWDILNEKDESLIAERPI